MKKGLRNLVFGGAIALGLAGVVKDANAQQIVVNPFVQPNQSDLNWYGSGDVNNDNIVDWKDVSKLDSIIDGSYVPNLNSSNPVEYRTLDRADVSGDGLVDSLDKKILEDKLSGNINYMPGEWDKLESKESRQNLHKQRHDFQGENKLDTMIYIPDVFDCDNFARLNVRDFKGFSELGYDKESGWKDNGRYNLPEFYVEFLGESVNHVVTGAVVGDSINSLDDWDIRERNGLKFGEDVAFPDCEIVINYSYFNQNDGFLDNVSVVKFNISNGEPEFSWMNDDPNVKIYTDRLSATDQKFEELNISNPVQDSIYKDDIFFKYELKDKNLDLDNSYYKLNGVQNYFAYPTGGILLDSKQGLNKLEVFASDKAGNSKSEIINYIYDTTSVDTNGTLVNETIEDKVLFYPNPVSTTATLKHNVGEDIDVNIYNASGQRIYSKRDIDGDGKVDLDFSDYASGIYFYQTSTGNSGEILKK